MIYPDDLVRLRTQEEPTMGWVCCIGEDSRDSPSTVHTLWHREDNNDTVEKLEDLVLYDRTALLCGDVVRRATGESPACTGQIIGLSQLVEIKEVESGVRRDGVLGSDVAPLHPIDEGLVVACKQFLGHISSWDEDVTVEFNDGAVCKVKHAQRSQLVPFDYCWEHFSPYYPGMRVTGIGDTFKTAEWLSGEYKQSRCKGVVKDVEHSTIEVEWFVSITDAAEVSLPKASKHTLDELKIFETEKGGMWRLGQHGRLDGVSVEVCGVKTTAAVLWETGEDEMAATTELIFAYPGPH